ncbi:hypothetical protein JCM10450v2_006403 [Rhodotorula kratochvilovae]
MPQLDTVFSDLAISHKRYGGRAGHAKSATKPQSAQTTTDASEQSTTNALLALLSRIFLPTRRAGSFTTDLQHVKGLLYNKEYLAAFGTDLEEGERWREVYVARWTPARTVVYERILEECGVAAALQWEEPAGKGELTEEQELELERERARRRRRARQEGKADDEAAEPTLSTATADEVVPDVVEAIMIGAGAGSEVVALGGLLGAVAARQAEAQGEEAPRRRPRVKVHAVDQGSWASLLSKMEDGLREDWPSLAGDETLGGGFDIDFVKGDVFATAPTPLTASAPSSTGDSAVPALDLPFSSPSLRLITICFTITELLLQSRLSTLRLLSHISRSAPSGTLFLVVESASLALIPLGKEGRTYPLGQLLDHALCGAQGDGAWETLRSEDAKWYRMPEGAEDVYNAGGKGAIIKLENSRVVLRLYRKK